MARAKNVGIVSNVLKQRGWSDHAVNALVGGFIQESGGSGDLNPRAVHDNKTGYGIAGYRDPEPGKGRRTNLFAFAKANGIDPSDPATQALFADHELGGSGAPGIVRMKGPGFGSEARPGNMLRNASDLTSAARGAIAFERPQGFSWDRPEAGHGWDNRISNASKLAGLPIPQGIMSAAAMPDHLQPPVPTNSTAAGAPTIANAASMTQPYVDPTPPPTEDALKLSDLQTAEGWTKLLGSEKVSEPLKDIMKATKPGEQGGQSGAEIITPSSLGNDDFASRFAAASQLMALRRRGPLGV